MILSYIIYTNHSKATVCKTNNLFIVTSVCPKYYCTQLSYAKKQLWRNLVSVNLKLKK